MAPSFYSPNTTPDEIYVELELSLQERLRWWVCDWRDTVATWLERIAVAIRGEE